MSANVYAYFEEGVRENRDESNNYLYVCKLCKEKGINRIIKSVTTSNLIAHLKTEIHHKEYLAFEAKQNECTSPRTPKSKKMRLQFSESPLRNSVTHSPKYAYNSIKHKERYFFVSLTYVYSLISLFNFNN